MTSRSAPGLTWLNSSEEEAARAALHRVCAARAWAAALLGARPFPDLPQLLDASDTAVAALSAEDVDEALAGHPRIGRPEPSDAVSSREQRGMADASERLRAEMLELNLAYQEKFGHPFLVCATGLTGEQLRDAARHRLGNPPEHEREVVRTELGKINRLRLTRLADEGVAA